MSILKRASKSPTALTAALLSSIVITATGCASSGGSALSGPQRVTLAEFSQPRGSASDNAASAVDEGDRAVESHIAPPRLAASSDVATGSVSEPVRSRPPMQPGDAYIVDGLVGQIQGRPIFADAFFAPIEDQLRQMRRSIADHQQFSEEVGRLIVVHLWQHARDELFLTEAESLLPPEQRQGLFAFMRHLREEEIRLGGGTRAGAQQRLAEREGMTIDEHVRERMDQELVTHLFQQKIAPRVIVSWRDVQREYRRRAQEFNPPPTLHLSRLQAPADDEERIAAIQAAIEAGEPFDEIVARLGQSGDGPWQAFPVGPEGYHDIGAAEMIRERLIGLAIGETTEPFQVGRTMIWLHLARVERISRSIYDLDVQRGLMREIQQRRMAAEEDRYIRSLFDRAIEVELNRIALRLHEIALQRYGMPG